MSNQVLPSTALLEMWSVLQALCQSECFTRAKEFRTLAAVRDTLLPKLISGELRVKDAELMAGNFI